MKNNNFAELFISLTENTLKPTENIHIGRIIQQQLKEQSRTVTFFARQMHCSRSNIYKIFLRSSIDTDLLLRASKILKYNFFKHLLDRL